MSLENNISEVIQKQLQGDLIEKVVAEQLEKCIKNAVDRLFGNWGDCTKIVEEKIKEVMVPQLEKYDYSKHIVKLDYVLTDILKATKIDNRKILENFKGFMLMEEVPKEIKVSDIYHRYMKYVADNVDTYGLEVVFDDGPSYEYVETEMEIEEEEGRSWSSFKYAKLFMECKKKDEEQEDLNVEVSLSRWNKDKENVWSISFSRQLDLTSLRYMDDFTIYLIKLAQNGTKVIVDTWSESDEVIPSKEPEPTYE